MGKSNEARCARQVELYNKAMSGRSTGRLSRFFGSNNGRTSPAPVTPAPSISVDDMLICQQVRYMSQLLDAYGLIRFLPDVKHARCRHSQLRHVDTVQWAGLVAITRDEGHTGRCLATHVAQEWFDVRHKG